MATRSGDKSLEIRVITTESDIPQLARVKTAAFKDYDLHVAMYPVDNGAPCKLSTRKGNDSRF
jgi:hypothetical protein